MRATDKRSVAFIIEGDTMQTIQIQYNGHKARVGGLCFDEKGSARIFAGYCDGCLNKCVMTREEAEKFAGKFRYENDKLTTRVLNRLIRSRTL